MEDHENQTEKDERILMEGKLLVNVEEKDGNR